MSGGEGKEEMNENENKSSMEILSELFSKFDADPPVIIKKEKDESSRKHKKSKKKHKHKEKKHKKKSKKHKVRNSSESDSSNGSGIDLTDILKSEDCNSSLSETIKKIIKMDTKTMSKSNVKEVKEKEKKSHKRKKHKSNHSDDDRKKCKKMKFEEKSRKDSPERYKEHKRSIDRSESKYREEKHKYRDDYKYRDYRYKDDYRSKDYDDDKRHKYRDNPFYRDRSEDRYFDDRHRTYDRDRDKEDSDNYIDKKKLLEIARRNAIQMMKSGSLPGALTLGPQAQEKVIAAIRSGGKTVEELTDFCKTLSKQEELGELSSISDVNSSESDGDQPFHHPFQIKDKPLTINIKNSVPLPIKSNQERASELRIQFPVSSGQQHRKTESEWVPVEPKAIEAPPPVLPKPIPVEEPEVIAPAPVVVVPPGPQAFPSKDLDEATLQENVDIASIVSQRLTAMRKLQENPHDVQAITEMFQAQKEMNTWAESKQQVGQFTGSTGAQILSQAELSAGYQAWARKDQLQTAAPVSGGMGMHLLQKMGWRPGEGLGKEKTGTLEPLLLEVKLDKKGIVAKEEQKKIVKPPKQPTKTLQGKHPVSLLGEYASKRKLGAPQYTVDFECGPDHKKNFLFKVLLNGIEYKPNVASSNKKEAKALAATICLQQLGLLPV